MDSKDTILSLLEDLRGRLDEIEHLVKKGEDFVVPTPTVISGDNLTEITPGGFHAWRADGVDAPLTLERYQALSEFFQFAASEDDTQCTVSTFDLSDLHKTGDGAQFGLRADPSIKPQEWFTYELLQSGDTVLEFDWTQWILKVATDEPCAIFCQFILDAGNESYWVDGPSVQVNEFASFIHIRLGKTAAMEAVNGNPIDRVRLILNMGRTAIPLRLYDFRIFAKS